MREDFLHYLWKYKKFDTSNLKTVNNEPIQIQDSGNYHQLAGPDFFNAQLIIGSQKWAGNVEIHLKSSDWYIHHHEIDEAYENVILHVVWDHDTEIYRRNNTEIPVLELRNYVDRELLQNYSELNKAKSWIFCESQLANVSQFILQNWKERLFFERLERKSTPIVTLLDCTQQDWEAVLFNMLARNFGLNTNGEAFLTIAMQIPFSIIRKESADVENLEALFFGFAGLLSEEKEDQYFNALTERFTYLTQKYQLKTAAPITVAFFKHRPDNFPTIRLSQLAALYSTEPYLFTKIIAAQNLSDIYALCAVSVSDYWQTHYQFDRQSPRKSKALSKSFIDLLIINTIIPIQFAYAKYQGRDNAESLINLLDKMSAESNAVIDKFASFGIMATNAFESQSLLQLKKEYCDKKRCMECAIGTALLQRPS